MKKSTIITVLVFGILLVCYIVILRFHKPKEPVPRERICDFLISDVKKIETFPGRITVAKSPKDAEWYIVSHKNIKAGKTETEIYLDDIKELRYLKVVTESTTDLAQYGLQPEEASVRLTFVDNTKEVLYMGCKNPDGTGIYVRTDKSPKIYLVESHKKNIFLKKVSDFRERQIFKFNAADINKFIFLIDKKKYIATYLTNEKRWEITKPVTKKMDPEDINEILFNLEALRIYDFIEEKAELQNTGLNAPAKVLNLFSKKEKYNLKIGNKGRKGYYATRDGEPFYLDPYFVEGQLKGWLEKLETVSTKTN